MQIETNNQNQTQRRRSDDDVLQLLVEYRQTQDISLRDRIVMQYTGLVESIARRFSGSAEPVEDLAQEGYIGLITAIDLYNPTKNVKFSTYATHFIIGQIKHCLRDRGKIIKEPAWLQELNQRISRTMDALSQQLGRTPTNAEIAEVVGMAEEAVGELLMTREIFKVASIDGGSDNEDDSGTVNLDRKSAIDVSVSFQLPLEDKIVLEAAMEKLKELEQKVVTLFYHHELNQTEIAKQLGISCNYVSHILRKATKSLGKYFQAEQLREEQKEKAQLLKRLEAQQQLLDQLTVVDSLTRLYNRRYFEDRLDEELLRGSRSSLAVALIFIQVNGLDTFIRTHGTLKGDEAVVEIAQTIRGTVRRVDIVTRHDVDTFALILPATGEKVSIVCDRLLKALASLLGSQKWDGGRAPLVVGLGSATFPLDSSQPAELTEKARQAIALPSDSAQKAA